MTPSAVYSVFRYPEAFAACLGRFVEALGMDGAGMAAIDARTLRRSSDRAASGSALHAVTAFGTGRHRPHRTAARAPRRNLAQVSLIICVRCRSQPSASPGRPAPTGVSRTAGAGSSTWPSTRTAPETARTTDPKTSPHCASSPSTGCEPPDPTSQYDESPCGPETQTTSQNYHRPNAIALTPGPEPLHPTCCLW